MKKIVLTLAVALVVAATVLLSTASPSFAAKGKAPVAGCQPGADSGLITQWQLLSLEEYAQLLYQVGKAPDLESAIEWANVTYAFCDRNGDNYTCVMEQNLPNDANGSSHWFLIEDNHPYGGQ